MYQVLFKIESEWFHLDGLFNNLDSATEQAYSLKNAASSIESIEIVKMVMEENAIVSREFIKSF